MRAESRIVNTGSVSGVLTTPFAGAYRATKSALHSLSDALRMALNPFGIHVIIVQPGAIRSSFGDHASEAVDAC
ncbi:MAG: SDR family NAD(P)-dependent oxidoreductase [Pseudomonadota bacterium]|nr:SDR family NAD(P)-dependent oxidoreductase [Pseudomonadota bacterium]